MEVNGGTYDGTQHRYRSATAGTLGRSGRSSGAQDKIRENKATYPTREGSKMPVDAALVGALHVEYLAKRDLVGEGRPHHTLFQTSTIEALLGGNYDGDVTFAELGARGDFGLGTLDALDGEMVALDGAFYQIKAGGRTRSTAGRGRRSRS